MLRRTGVQSEMI